MRVLTKIKIMWVILWRKPKKLYYCSFFCDQWLITGNARGISSIVLSPDPFPVDPSLSIVMFDQLLPAVNRTAGCLQTRIWFQTEEMGPNRLHLQHIYETHSSVPGSVAMTLTYWLSLASSWSATQLWNHVCRHDFGAVVRTNGAGSACVRTGVDSPCFLWGYKWSIRG